MNPRILIVEDDPDIIEVVRVYLEGAGFEVSAAKDGLSGLDEALQSPPDLIVLDWMLPGLDGLEFMRRLRREQRTPVVMLTARGEESDRVLGLELGADDYVGKPFSPRELVARVKAVLRRTQPQEGRDVLRRGDLIIDPERRLVTVAGSPVEVTTLEFDLLYTLAATPGRVFTRDELIERVWGDDFTGIDRVVDVHISNLRHKLEPVAGRQLIATVRGVGYKLHDSGQENT